ncbi:MAG: PKD domain-containing protein [Bacteroidetes bacterium]|nr:PKD domain-containing protein [Bacteroidota bacterium]
MKTRSSRLLIWLLCSILLPAAGAQTVIGGQINTYTRVLSIVPCSASLNVNQSSGFSVGQQVLIIQMQGATINDTNSAGFGNITNLHGAGQHEKARIKQINGNIIKLENSLLNEYDTDASVQLVSFPEYQSASVGSTLIAQDWNGQTGGVLALEVSDTLWLQADIEASATGFRGGQLQNPESDCFWLIAEDDYYYEEGNWRGAWKGEGIANYLSSRELGRGAQANGGGGGNDHNAGGGGGGHFTAGGRGGFQTPPSTFGCSGNFPGQGGKAIPSGDRIFLGGGGGAGHSDDPNAGTAGGAGGGIILLKAGTVIGNNHEIRANGESVNQANGDGAGGGGAGGTIVFLVNEFSGPLLLSANGGTGGSTQNPTDRCYGPGGGGSGGRILSNLASLPATDLSGGSPGANTNTNSNCTDPVNGAQSGNTGMLGMQTDLPQSTDTIEVVMAEPLPKTTLLCEGEAGLIVLEYLGDDADFQWQVNMGSGYMNLSDGPEYEGTTTPILTILNPQLSLEGAVFRCVLNSACFGVVFSTDTEINMETDPEGSFSLVQTDNLVELVASSTNAGSYVWYFGDDSTATGPVVSHEYAAIGIYPIELILTNACGSLILYDTVQVGNAPEASFNLDLPGGCAPLEVSFTDISANDPDTWLWSFPGGDPASSNEQNPTVLYSEPGVYDVSLEATNAVGSSSFTIEAAVEVFEAPLADFIYQINGDTVVFASTSTGDITSYQWIFGDDPDPSNEANPEYVFPGPGVYEVTLSVSNPHCGSFVTYIVEIINTAVAEIDGCKPNVWPVPASTFIQLEYCEKARAIKLFDISGKCRYQHSIDSGNGVQSRTIPLEGLAPGMYYLHILSENGQNFIPIVIQR